MSSALVSGDVVLPRFSFTDLAGASFRAALVISQELIGRILFWQTFLSIIRGAFGPTDYTADTTHPEYPLTGLRAISVLRLHKLAVMEQSVLARRLGRRQPQLQTEADERLRIVGGL